MLEVFADIPHLLFLIVAILETFLLPHRATLLHQACTKLTLLTLEASAVIPLHLSAIVIIPGT